MGGLHPCRHMAKGLTSAFGWQPRWMRHYWNLKQVTLGADSRQEVQPTKVLVPTEREKYLLSNECTVEKALDWELADWILASLPTPSLRVPREEVRPHKLLPSAVPHSLSQALSPRTGHSQEVVPKPEGSRTETFSPQPPEQGAEEWRGQGRTGGGGRFVSGNKNSNPASPKP